MPRARRFAGVVVLLVSAAALIGGYAWYVLSRIDSFSARDLRALSTLAAQIESEIDGHAQTVLDIAAAGPADNLLAKSPPAYADFVDLKSERAAPSGLVRKELTLTLTTAAPKPHLEIRSFAEKTNTEAAGVVPIDKYVHPFFEQSFLGVFEVLLLTTTNGKILAQTPTATHPPLPPLLNVRNHEPPDGRVADGVVVKDLSALERRDGFRSWSPLNVRELRGASGRTEVRINETEYYLFTQPVRFQLESGDAVATNGMGEDSGGSDLLVGALIRKPKLRGQAMAISDSLVLIGIGILVLLACSFPFSRIVALPKGAPLRAVDVVLAAVAAVVASAVLTVVISDTVTYRRMYSLENQLLAKYANNLRRDILRDLTRSAVAAEALRDSSQGLTASMDDYTVDWTKQELFQQPYIESLVWADAQGNTTATAAIRGKAPPKTSLGRRRFFSDVKNNNWWTILERTKDRRDVPHEVIVEVVPSRDDPQTIVAVPSRDPNRVFAASLRFIHFIDPVVPPGFGFAVIDDRGIVQFHSDKHRALHENFFRETEDDRQLRAAVYARRDAQISARYWGNDYQLYVAPVPGTAWTVITMREELLLRSVNSEIVALTALLLALYAAVYAAAFVFLAAVNPRYRAPWLWPNHKGWWEYFSAAIALTLEVMAFTACVLFLDSWEALYVAFLAPLRGLCTAFIIASTDPKERKQRGIGLAVWTLLTSFWMWVVTSASLAPIVSETHGPRTLWLLALLIAIPLLPMLVPKQPWAEMGRIETFIAYKLSGMLMVVGIAMIPAFAFLQVATRLGSEARIKYSQLVLADLLEKRIVLLERISMREPRIAFDCYTIPYIFDSAWTVAPRATTPRPMTIDEANQRKKRPAKDRRILLKCREDSVEPAWFPQSISLLLPHYSEGSVALRNLEFNTASDHTWRWCRDPYALLFQKKVEFDAHTVAKLYGGPRPVELMVLTPLPMVMHQQQWFSPQAPPTADLHCPAPPDSFVGDPAALAGMQDGIDRPFHPGVFDRVRTIFWITGLFLFFYLPFSGVGFMGLHVFLYRVEPPDWQSPKTLKKSAGENLFVVDPAPETVQSPGVLRLMHVVRNRKGWSALRASVDAESPMIDLVLDDFTDVFFSDARDDLLSFMEDVLGAKRRAVQVISRVSAATLLEMVSNETRERWKQLFAQFAHLGDAANAAPVPKLLKDENRFVFERIWADSAPDERLVMYQLARDGLVNEKNSDVLKRLMGRGLVQRSPELELITPGLERFVMATVKPEQVAAAERETGMPRWTSLGIAVTVLIIAGVTVIFTSQKDVINYTSGIITAIAAAVPALLKLIAVLSGRAPADNP